LAVNTDSCSFEIDRVGLELTGEFSTQTNCLQAGISALFRFSGTGVSKLGLFGLSFDVSSGPVKLLASQVGVFPKDAGLLASL
jgi:hypothetical protein